MATLQDLKDIVYDIIGESESDSSRYPSDFITHLINTAELRICTGAVKNPINGKVVKKGQLPFLNTDYYYSIIADASLTTATTVGATTLYADTTNFSSTGKLYINGNIITYTGKTSTTFTGCSNVLFAFPSGTQVSPAYTLPTNFGSMKTVIFNNKMKLPQISYDDMYEQLNSGKYSMSIINNPYNSPYGAPIGKSFYTIKDRAYLLIFNIGSNGDQLRMRYEKLPTAMSATTDSCTIDNDTFAKTTIPYIAVGELMYNRGEESRGAEVLNFGLGQLGEMYEFYNNSTYEEISGVAYGLPKSQLNI